jgi:multimeric flavodoxin WrbA
MNILIINGSPKGKNSITLQTVLYLEKCFPEHSFEILHAGQRIRSLEKDFQPAARKMHQADLILFSYPVYTFLAPSQLHRFMELTKASGVDLSGIYATQITTSKHFYDVTAHRYIQENCQDLGMKFIRGLSADMEDLLKKEGQKSAVDFFRYVCWCMKKDIYESVIMRDAVFEPAVVHVPESGRIAKHQAQRPEGNRNTSFSVQKPVIIVTDCREDDQQLSGMIKRFQSVMPCPTRLINIREYPFQGGCLGCFHCAITGECIYKDKFDTFLREEIQTGSAIVYAFTIQDHSMGSVFKTYDDRQFCNGHRTVTMGMPFGYLISGPYHQEENLRMVVEARAEVGGNFLAGVATDEQETDRQIDQLAERLSYVLRHRYIQPQNFYGVGGMKIFRDLIYQMRGMMKADHKFYKKHHQYDFPQKKKGTILMMYLVGAMLSSPKLQKKAGSKMTEGMLMPYKKVLEKALL